MKITKAGQLGGDGSLLEISLPTTAEQQRLGMGATIELDYAPLTPQMRITARKLYPDVMPPRRKISDDDGARARQAGRAETKAAKDARAAGDEDAAKEHEARASEFFMAAEPFDFTDPDYLLLRVERARQQRIAQAAQSLTAAGYFAADNLDANLKTILGPASLGGLDVDGQIIPLALAADAASSMTPERKAEVTDGVRPTGSGAADPAPGE